MTCRDEDARRRRAEGPRRLDELELARAEHLSAHEPRVPDPPDQRQREHDIRRGSGRAPPRVQSPAAVRETPAGCRSTRLIASSIAPPKYPAIDPSSVPTSR